MNSWYPGTGIEGDCKRSCGLRERKCQASNAPFRGTEGTMLVEQFRPALHLRGARILDLHPGSGARV